MASDCASSNRSLLVAASGFSISSPGVSVVRKNLDLDDSIQTLRDSAEPCWPLTGTTREGTRKEVRGCDFYTFRNGKVIRKDSYWKIVE